MRLNHRRELFLNGLHLEQYRHATYSPEPYYLEALRRDPGDSRCNNAMGLLLYRRGKFAEAETYFRRAIERLTQRNPNPYDGEPYYNLGLTLKMQRRFPEAFDAFHKAVWNAAWQDSGYFELACLASRKRDIPRALEYVDRSLSRNGRHHKARHLKIALLRHAGDRDAARHEVNLALSFDPLDYGTHWERFLLDADPAFDKLVRPTSEIYLELALDYAHAGLFEDAVQLLERSASSSPMVAYTLGWVLSESGRMDAAQQAFQVAAGLSVDYCFPNHLEDPLILETAMRTNRDDPRAPYYLGNFWYAHRRYDEAIACWERSCALDPSFPTVHRNLGLAYYNRRHEPEKALEHFETAFNLDTDDARVFFELDQLYKRFNRPAAWRLVLLEKYADLVERRDDLSVEHISLLNLSGRHEEARQQLMQRNFHPWEGGEGKVTGQYVASLMEIARAALDNGQPRAAIEVLEKARVYPYNLGEGKLYGAQENNIFYYLGCAFELLGEIEESRVWFERAATGLSEPTSAIYYNDQPPDMIFYQGLANLKLNRKEAASAIFNKLVEFGAAHLDDNVGVDYFAVSLPDFLVFDVDLKERNRIHCLYMMALGELGLANFSIALEHFDSILALDASHLGATLHRRLIK